MPVIQKGSLLILLSCCWALLFQSNITYLSSTVVSRGQRLEDSVAYPAINVTVVDSVGESVKELLTSKANHSEYRVSTINFEDLELVRLVGKGEVSYGFEATLHNRTVMAKIATNRDVFFSNTEIDLVQRLKTPPTIPNMPDLHGAIRSMPNPFRHCKEEGLQEIGLSKRDAKALMDARKISVIVMDFLANKQTLPDILSDIRTYLRSLLETLQFAHSRSVMHLDLHVGNIFWNGSSVSLFDWNAGRVFTPDTPHRIGNQAVPEAKHNVSAVHASVSAFDIYTVGKLLKKWLLKNCCNAPASTIEMKLAYSLADFLMAEDPLLRPDAATALQHPFFQTQL